MRKFLLCLCLATSAHAQSSFTTAQTKSLQATAGIWERNAVTLITMPVDNSDQTTCIRPGQAAALENVAKAATWKKAAQSLRTYTDPVPPVTAGPPPWPAGSDQYNALK